jgi:hypothetical protein
MKGWKKTIFNFLNITIGDYDGINSSEVMFEWNHDKNSLKSFFKKNGAKKIYITNYLMCAVF